MAGDTKFCKKCGFELGHLVTIEQRGASVVVLEIGGVYLIDGRGICPKCGTQFYQDMGIFALVELLRQTGRITTVAHLEGGQC